MNFLIHFLVNKFQGFQILTEDLITLEKFKSNLDSNPEPYKSFFYYVH